MVISGLDYYIYSIKQITDYPSKLGFYNFYIYLTKQNIIGESSLFKIMSMKKK